MRVTMSIDGDGDGIALLEGSLRERPELLGIEVWRGQADVETGKLGAAEVLIFLATEVSLPLVLNAVYDFFRHRRRSRPAEEVRVFLTRTELPGGARKVELRLDGPADAAIKIVQAVLTEHVRGD